MNAQAKPGTETLPLREGAYVLLYRKGDSLVNWLIRWFTFSRYHHVSLLIVNRLELLELSVVPTRGVFVQSFATDRMPAGVVADVFALECNREQALSALSWFLRHAGEKYDFWAGANIGFFRRWRQPGSSRMRWTCSEAIFEALAQSGVAVLERIPAHQAAPGHFNLSPLLKGPLAAVSRSVGLKCSGTEPGEDC